MNQSSVSGMAYPPLIKGVRGNSYTNSSKVVIV